MHTQFSRCVVLILMAIGIYSCVHVPSANEQLEALRIETGLKPVTVEGASSQYLSKTHRGYKMLLRIQMGDVWSRYAARVAAGEIGRELGGIWSFLTGSYKSGVGSVVGSPYDRLLSQIIGQPLSLTIIATHQKQKAARLDIYNEFSTIQPPDKQPKIQYIGLSPGTLYSSDSNYAKRVLSDKQLVAGIENFRSQYIRVDDVHASFMFAGSENDYGAMIRNHGNSSPTLYNAIMDTLAGLIDHL